MVHCSLVPPIARMKIRLRPLNVISCLQVHAVEICMRAHKSKHSDFAEFGLSD